MACPEGQALAREEDVMKSKIRYYLPGAVLIAISLLIVAVPEILVVFVASLLCIFGITALYLGHIARKQKVRIVRMESWDSDTDLFEDQFERIPVYQFFLRW